MRLSRYVGHAADAGQTDLHDLRNEGGIRAVPTATFDGLACLDLETLELSKVVDLKEVVDTGRLYATNALPDGTFLVHDLCGKDDSVYVYGCSGNGAIVRFFDVAHSNKYVISNKGEKYFSEDEKNFAL